LDLSQLFVTHLPEAVLSGLALVVLMAGAVPAIAAGLGARRFLPWLAVGSLTAVPALLVWLTPDGFGFYSRFAVGVLGLLVLLAYWPDVDAESPGEFLSAILFSVAGVMLVAGAEDLIVLFLGLELVSLPTYLLVSLGRRHLEAQEAGNKYFFLSILSAAVLLYGFSFLYGTTGTLRLMPAQPETVRVLEAEIASAQAALDAARAAGAKAEAAEAEAKIRAVAGRLRSLESIPTRVAAIVRDAASGAKTAALPLLVFGAVLTVAGLAFKLAAAPMHFYAPDVYQGAQPAVAGMMASIPKAAGLFAALKLAIVGLLPLAAGGPEGSVVERLGLAWFDLFWVLAALSMTVGNLVALWQTNIKRLLAYSSIAHSGYLLVGLTAVIAAPAGMGAPQLTANGAAAAMFYVFTYGVMTVGAFAALSMLRTASGESAETLDDVAGLARRSMPTAVCLSIFLFGLTGLPPTAGFLGKLSLFGAALTGPAATGGSAPTAAYWLVLVGLINSAISAYYYLGVVGAMWMREPVGRVEPMTAPSLRYAVWVSAALTVVWGVVPGWLMDRSLAAARDLHILRGGAGAAAVAEACTDCCETPSASADARDPR
jgi:NADH-quinone oxidoreductase subunit N